MISCCCHLSHTHLCARAHTHEHMGWISLIGYFRKMLTAFSNWTPPWLILLLRAVQVVVPRNLATLHNGDLVGFKSFPFALSCQLLNLIWLPIIYRSLKSNPYLRVCRHGKCMWNRLTITHQIAPSIKIHHTGKERPYHASSSVHAVDQLVTLSNRTNNVKTR